MKLSMTVDDLMNKTNLSRMTCYGFLRFLEDAGIATVTAAPREAGQRGRSVAVYCFPDTFALALNSLMSKEVELVAATVDEIQPTREYDVHIELDQQATA